MMPVLKDISAKTGSETMDIFLVLAHLGCPG